MSRVSEGVMIGIGDLVQRDAFPNPDPCRGLLTAIDDGRGFGCGWFIFL